MAGTKPAHKTVYEVTRTGEETGRILNVPRYVYLVTGELRQAHVATKSIPCTNPRCKRDILEGELCTLHGHRTWNGSQWKTTNNQPYCDDCVKFYEEGEY